MKNEEKVEDLLAKGSFETLDLEDRNFVLSLMTPEAFDELRNVTLLLSEKTNSKEVIPRGETLHQLQLKMRGTMHDNSFWLAIFQVRMPAYATVLLMVLSALTAIFLSKENSLPQERISVMVKTDTVYVTKTDTMLREKMVYRYITREQAPVIAQDPLTLLARVNAVRVSASMKEKEDLNKFLVSDTN